MNDSGFLVVRNMYSFKFAREETRLFGVNGVKEQDRTALIVVSTFIIGRCFPGPRFGEHRTRVLPEQIV